MKRFPIIGALLLIPAVMLTLVVGCDKGEKKTTTEVKKETKEPTTSESVAITAEPKGVLTGVVTFKGDVPEAKPEERIMKHDDKKLCLAGGGKNVLEQMWLIKNGKVENVVISLEPPAGKKFKISDELKEKFAKKEAVIDQPYCAYVPHIVALYAGVEPLLIKNSAKFPHNVKIAGGVKNGDTNDPVAPGAHLKPRTFKKDSNPIPVECSMHTWMNAKILTFDHPYFAVTNEKGEYKIENIPVGEEFTIKMWHESMDKKKDAGTVTTKAGEKTTRDLEISK